VVWSLKRHLADESKSLAKGFLSAVTDIRADGQNVIIEHATGDADIPAILGVYQLVIIPEDWTDFSTIAGTGPYRQVSYEPGGRFVGERNPNYWKSDRAWFDRVEMTTIPDPQAREQALIDGAVDAIDNVNFLTFDRYRDNPDFTALETKGGRFITMVMDVRSAPFDDSNVRNAVKYAVARQDIIDKVIGYAVMGNDHPVPPSDPFFHTELPQRPFDPKKARWHLRQAGIDRLNINLSVSETAFTGGVDTGILMQDTAFLSGIDLNITREKDDGYWSNVWMKKPFVQSFWTLRPTPAMMYTVAFACGSPSAEAFWCDDRATSALTAAKTEPDFDKRKQHFWDLQELTAAEGGNIIPAFISDLDIYSKKLGGVQSDGVARMMGFKLAERCWFA
ncbi:MAG: ABC transporter substrate-binding protein, partial [Pseudomonadota bacterium]